MTVINFRIGRFLVITSTAKMPSSVRSQYVRTGLIELSDVDAAEPKSIRASRTATVVRTWERLHCGATPACASARARAEAISEAKRRHAADTEAAS